MTEKKGRREGKAATAGVHAPDREAASSGLEARRPGSPAAGSATTAATTDAATTTTTTTAAALRR
jgi:hypothetical protein